MSSFDCYQPWVCNRCGYEWRPSPEVWTPPGNGGHACSQCLKGEMVYRAELSRLGELVTSLHKDAFGMAADVAIEKARLEQMTPSPEETEALNHAWMLCWEAARKGRQAGHAEELCSRFDGYSKTIRGMMKRMGLNQSDWSD